MSEKTCRECRDSSHLEWPNQSTMPGASREVHEVVLCPKHALVDELIEALTLMTEHRQWQLSMAGTSRKSDDIERAVDLLARVAKEKRT